MSSSLLVISVFLLLSFSATVHADLWDIQLASNASCASLTDYKILRVYTESCLDQSEIDYLYDEIAARYPSIITLCKVGSGCGKRQNTPNYVDFWVSPGSVAAGVAASLEATNSSNPNIVIASTAVTDPGSGGGGKSIPFWVWIIIAVGAVLIIGAVVGLVVYLKFIRPRGRSDMWNSARAMWGTKSGEDGAQGGLRTQTDHDVYNNI